MSTVTSGWSNSACRGDDMAVNGDFIQGYGAGKSKVAEATAEWLEENVDPETGYVLDSSLTVDNAAANAKAVGDILLPLKTVEVTN